MKKYLFLSVVCSALFFQAAHAFEGDRQVSGTFSYYLPSAVFYDLGVGGEVKYAVWNDDGRAFAISLGYARWGVEADTRVQLGGGGAVGVGFGGDVTTIPIGASVIWRNETDYSRNLDVSLELGAKYMLSDSEANATTVTIANGGREVGETPISVDDNVVAFISMDLAYLPNDERDISFGVGYNYDVLKGDIKAAGGNIAENEFKGVFFNIGYTQRF